MRGAYLLIIRLGDETTVRTRAREFHLRPGYYVYVGSAMNSLEARVRRHMSRHGHKRLHWHIDYLLERAEVLEAILIPSEERIEERLSDAVSRLGNAVEGFGASDLRVSSNLYRFDEHPEDLLMNLLSSMGLGWKTVKSVDEI
ncbi:MAG: DUF123 domain-containing protein [Thermococci archaeon]|nr:DUF123 domain-containing protein [Thermococci archaeon]